MNLVSEDIEKYCREYTTPESATLRSLNLHTHDNIADPAMLSGHLQGAFLSLLSFMIRPKAILEIGTYTGYSAICMARGLQEGGVLHTIDINEDLKDMVVRYVSEAGYSDQIRQHIGNALDIIPTLSGPFDLVFIDADKVNYSNYYDAVFDKLNSGAYIVADNVLWSGEVLNENRNEDAEALHLYNEKIHSDPRVENVLVPIRDGLMIARKL